MSEWLDRVTALEWALDRGALGESVTRAALTGAVVWRAPARIDGIDAIRDVTPSRVEADALGGAVLAALPAGPLPSAVAFLGRDREENLSLLGVLLTRLEPGAPLVTTGCNSLGSGWYDKTLAEAGLDVEVASKHKCRVAVTRRPEVLPEAVEGWAALSEPMEVAPRLWTCPGVFSKGHIDPASALLASSLPRLEGHVGDWGAGWGYLAASLADRGDAVTRFELVEADQRALTLALRALEVRGAVAAGHWLDARQPTGLRSLDVIVTNPPFHDGDRHAVSVAHAFFGSAAAALRGAGRIYAVGPRNLPYDEPLRATFERTRVLADGDGFRVYEGSHPRRRAAPLSEARPPRRAA